MAVAVIAFKFIYGHFISFGCYVYMLINYNGLIFDGHGPAVPFLKPRRISDHQGILSFLSGFGKSLNFSNRPAAIRGIKISWWPIIQ